MFFETEEKGRPHEVVMEDLAAIYRLAFSQVCPSGNLKSAIDCIVPAPMAEFYGNAIEFVTGRAPFMIGPVSTDTMVLGFRITSARSI